MGDCLFCKIAEGEISSGLVYSDEQVVAFKDIHPQAPVHLVVIPRRHLSRVSEVGEDDAQLMGNLVVVANQLARKFNVVESGYRLVVNCNAGAGQSVFHLHLHLLGGRPMRWPPG